MLHCREIQALITSFGSHLNVDLQQRGVEFTQLFGSYKHLRPPLLEKMPAMQISRISSQNGESGGSFDDNSPDVIENGVELGGSSTHPLIESNMNTMGDNTVSYQTIYTIQHQNKPIYIIL